MWEYVLFALLVFAIAEWLHYNITKPLPGPWGWPVLYSLPSLALSIVQQRSLQHGIAVRERYGRTFQLRLPGLGRGPYVLSTHPEDVEFVLQGHFENFPKAPHIKDILEPVFGEGIFSADGHEWLVQRKAASNAFRVTDIKNSIRVFKRVSRDLIAVLEALQGKEFDMQTLMASATLSGFCEAAFSMHVVDVGEKETPFAFHFNRLQACMNLRAANPLYKLMPWSKNEREIRESAEYLNEVAYAAIKEARAREADHPPDLLTPFLAMDGVSDKYLRDVFMNLLVAGRDTTSQTLAWCAHYLATHPEVQEKLHAEIGAALPNEDSEPQWKVHTDGKLPYLNAVLKETLRLSPPVPIDIKIALKDCVLPSGAVIKAGSTFDWWQWGMSRDPCLWEEPLAFRPERWLEAPKDPNIPAPPTSNRPPWSPFQYGPRVCLGKRMAENDMEVTLSMLVKRFRFLPGSHEPQPNIAVALYAANGIPLRAQRRPN